MAAIDVPTFEQIATILSQLSTNYTNIFADYYNLFYNPEPMDITVQIYDDAGNLSTITIPNRAKDLKYVLNGNGDPNNTVSAPRGSVYQDLANGTVYVKQFANTDNTGWSEFMTLDSIEDFIIQGAGSPEGIVAATKGVLFIDRTNAALYLKSTATGNTGWILISADTANLANKDLSNLSEVGNAHFANPSLSNLNTTGAALINSKENVSNKTTTIDSDSTDTQYPTAKAVYDLVGTGTSDLANKSLSNLNATGEDKFIHTLSQVRDCIFKAPNGLPSVSGNIISLPTGTTLLCANGVNSNNQVVNDKVTTTSALSISVSWTGAGNGAVFYNGTSNNLNYKSEDEYFRQVSQPTITTTNGMWYNPNTNEYKLTSNSGSTWTTIKAAEIGRFTTDGSGNINSFYPYRPLRVALEDDLLNIKFPFRNLCEIVASTIPLTDAGLHLLDGSLIQGSGIYSAFVDYIASIYDASASYFCTEAEWQASVTQYGVCGKFVYDSVNNTVRLPKYSNKIYTQDISSSTPVVGNGISLGLTNGTKNMGLLLGGYESEDFLFASEGVYGKPVGSSGGNTNVAGAVGVVSDGTKSGLVAQLSDITTSLEGYYYIVVATSAKTDIQVDIDEVTTDLNGKADADLSNVPNSKGILTESYVNGASWYRVYSDGWCEQGGITAQNLQTIQLLKAYANTNYIVFGNVITTDSNQVYGGQVNIMTKATTSFSFPADSGAARQWQACGYIR